MISRIFMIIECTILNSSILHQCLYFIHKTCCYVLDMDSLHFPVRMYTSAFVQVRSCLVLPFDDSDEPEYVGENYVLISTQLTLYVIGLI